MMTSTVSMVILSLFRGHKANYKVSLKINPIRIYHQILLFGLKKIRQVNQISYRVYIPLDDIGKLPSENITSRFLDRSFEIKIHNYKGKNWIFAVPKTQCHILVKNSKVTQKDNKLIVSLGKIAESDNWFSLHKVKCIGEKDTD